MRTVGAQVPGPDQDLRRCEHTSPIAEAIAGAIAGALAVAVAGVRRAGQHDRLRVGAPPDGPQQVRRDARAGGGIGSSSPPPHDRSRGFSAGPLSSGHGGRAGDDVVGVREVSGEHPAGGMAGGGEHRRRFGRAEGVQRDACRTGEVDKFPQPPRQACLRGLHGRPGHVRPAMVGHRGGAVERGRPAQVWAWGVVRAG